MQARYSRLAEHYSKPATAAVRMLAPRAFSRLDNSALMDGVSRGASALLISHRDLGLSA
jgi:hypothetical protein